MPIVKQFGNHVGLRGSIFSKFSSLDFNIDHMTAEFNVLD